MERKHTGMGAVDNGMLLILDIISIAKVTVRAKGVTVGPGLFFYSYTLRRVWAQSLKSAALRLTS